MSSVDFNTIGGHKIRSLPAGQVTDLKSVWQNQDAVVVFFRRWGCTLCRLWAKDLSYIAPVLRKHNIRLVGVGVESAGSEEFIKNKYFDGELYHVEDVLTYEKLGFKRFTVVSILTSLLWKQSRDAISKAREMGMGGDLRGDWTQTGGAVLSKGGVVTRSHVQKGPGDLMSNLDILKHFNLESEYIGESMANSVRENVECKIEAKP